MNEIIQRLGVIEDKQLALDIIQLLKKYDNFCDLIAYSIIGPPWSTEDAEYFRQIFCKRLVTLGYAKLEDGYYKRINSNKYKIKKINIY